MSKLKNITKADELIRLRKRKIQAALSAVRTTLNKEIGKLNYDVHFWLGSEGAMWFLNKNELDPDTLQSDFDKRGVEAYLEREQTIEATTGVQQLTLKYLEDLVSLLNTTVGDN